MESQVVENKINIDKVTQITKKVNVTAVSVALLLLALGVVAMSVGFFQEQLNSWVHNVLIFTGIILVIWAIIWILLKHKKYVYTSTGSTVKTCNYYIQREQMEAFKMLLAHAGFSLAKPILFQENGNVCIKVLKSNDARFAAAQMFEYVSFSFLAATQVYCYTDVQASDFIAFLDKSE
jgi:hypothetical protein